jgi:ABC-type transport system involved in multi-copper enzyme maturation permease subunit
MIINLIRGELYKLVRDRGTKLSFIIAIVASVLMTLIFKYQSNLGSNSNLNITGIQVFKALSSQFLFQNLIFSILAAEFIAKDFEKNTINRTFTYGYSRRNVIVSKLIAYFIAIIGIMAIHTLLTTIIISIFNGFGEYKMFSIIVTAIISIFCGIATASITGMIAIISQNVVITIISSVGLYIINEIMSFLFKFVVDILPFNIGQIAISSFQLRMIIIAIISSIITIILTIFVSTYKIEGRNIK